MAFIQYNEQCLYVASKNIFTYSPSGTLKKGSVCEREGRTMIFRDLETNAKFIIKSYDCGKMLGDGFLADFYDKISTAELQSYTKILLMRSKACKSILPLAIALIIIFLYSNLNSTMEILYGSFVAVISICPFIISEYILNKKRAQINEKIDANKSLTPSPNGERCIGNGSDENVECMCDECEHYLECFPNWRD